MDAELEPVTDYDIGMGWRWLGNISADERGVVPRPGETHTDAIRHRREWLAGKVIGLPLATAYYITPQLEAMGMVGVYAPPGS